MLKKKAAVAKRAKRFSIKMFDKVYGPALKEAQEEMYERSARGGSALSELAGMQTVRQPRRISSVEGRNTFAASLTPAELWNELRHSKIVFLLRQTSKSNHSEPYKLLLRLVLTRLEAEPPEGVFTPWSKTGKPGRPIDHKRADLYKTWLRLDQPSLFANKLAAKFYGREFTEANGIERKRLVEKCRRAVEREQLAMIKGLEVAIAKYEEDASQMRTAKEAARVELAETRSQLQRLGKQT